MPNTKGRSTRAMATPSATFDIFVAVLIGIGATPVVLLLMLWHVVTAYLPNKVKDFWRKHVG